MADFIGTDGDDIFTFPANAGDDDIEGEGGNDTLLGGAGDDHVDGYDGNDVVDGGAGEDRVRGQRGDDLGIYTLAENTRAPGVFDRDVYDGGRGHDTLRLHVTAGEFLTFQSQIVALESFIKNHQDTSSSSTGSDVTFKTSFGLEARNWESLEVFVDGQQVDPRDPAPRLDLDADDSTAAGTSFRTTFTEGGGRVPVVDADVRVLELGLQSIQSATLTILQRPDGASERLELSDEGKLLALQLGVAVDTRTPEGDSGSFVLALTGAASAADYERLLRAVEYNDRAQDPHDGDRLIQVVVSDGKNLSDAAFASVAVVGVNDAPENDFPGSVTLLEDEAAAVAGSVDDPDASRLRVTLEVEHGTLTLAPTDSVEFLEGDGRDDRRIVMEGSPGNLNDRLAGLVYTPDPDFAGSDRLSILTSDLGRQGTGGSLQDLDHVDLTVVPVNDRPSLVLQGDQTVQEDARLQVVRGFATAEPGGGPDEANQTFTFVVSNDNPDLFSLEPWIDASGTLVYRPAPNATGSATIRVNAKDSGGSELGTATSPTRFFTITVEPVNDDPRLILRGDQIVLEDAGPQTVAGFAAASPGGGADESAQTFVFTLDVDDPELFSVGPAIDADGNLTFTPNPDVAGTTSVKVTATDSEGGSSSSERFQITINPVNDRPTLALAGDVIVLEDSGRRSESDFAQANPGGGPDEEDQDFFYTVTTDNPGLFAEEPAISPGGRLSFAPAPDANGTATVTVEVTDDGGTADGGEDTSTPQTFTITVNPVNDAPTLQLLGDQVTIEDSGQQVVPGFATALPGGGPDEVNQGFVFRTFTMNPALFAEAPTISPGGTLVYTPRADAAGTARVLVSVTDSGGSSDGGRARSDLKAFTITINPVNDAPTFSLAESPIVAEDAGPQKIPGFATADAGGGTDEQGQTFSYTVVANSNPGLFADGPAIDPNGALTFTPQGDANGVATVTAFVTDSGGTAGGGANQSAPQTFTITVNPVNDAPLLVLQGDQIVDEDSGAHAVPDFATAFPGGGPDEAVQTSFNYSVNVTKGAEFFEAGPVISPAGALSYTLKPDAAGTAEIAVTVTDDGGTADGGDDTSAAQTFSITINPVNDRPTLALAGDLSILEDAGPQTVSGFATPNAGGGADEAAQTFEYGVSNDNPGLFALAPTILPDGTLRYETNPDVVGEATVTVIATDSGGTANGGSDTSAPAAFTITVNPVNDEPTFSLLGHQTVLEDAAPQAIAGFAVADAGGGPDEAPQSFTYRVDTDRPELFQQGPTISPTGTLSYVPNPDVVGTAKVTVQVTDSGGSADGGDPASGVQTFSITLNPVNDRPTLTLAGDQIVEEDSGLHSVADFARPDAGGWEDERFQHFTYEVTVVDGAELFEMGPQIDETGRLVFETRPDTNGVANVSVRVVDDGGAADGGLNTSDPVRFQIVVNPVNDPPTFTLLGDQAAFEDAGQQSVSGFAVAHPGGGPDEGLQTFSYRVDTDHAELFLQGPAISPDGTLTYTPGPDAVGTANVFVQLTDSGGTTDGGDPTSEIQTFTITLNPVNDAPSLGVAGDQIVNEDSGIHSVALFAQPDSGGGDDEAFQKFSYEVTVPDPTERALFASGPQIDASGRLVFETSADSIGTANVVVRVIDDGGTADGGQNTSTDVPFRIVVNPVNDAPTLTLLGKQAVLEDSGAQSVAGFAVAHAGGGADESNQTFTYTVVSDHLELFEKAPAISPAGLLTYTPAPDAVGTATVTVQVTDSGGNAEGGDPTSEIQTFTITLNPVNDAPSLSVAGDQIVNEDTGVHSVALFARPDSGGGDDEAFQKFSYEVVTDREDLFADGPQIDASGKLVFKTQADLHGIANVSVRVTDDGGTADGGQNTSDPPVRFRIVVNPVNDAPSISLLGDRIVVEDSGPQIVTGFATADAGGGETGQTFTYNVTTDKRELFAEAPTLSSDGTLTFTPQRDAIGTATVRVTVTDSGGTANGGQNTSAPQLFTITFNPVNDAPSLSLLGDRISNEDSGAQVVPHFATASPGGGPDEAAQTFTYSVTTDEPWLFQAQPTITPDGTLSYATQKDTIGTANVTVTVTDSGGTANGGRNISDPQTFSITVNPVNDAPSVTLLGNQITVEDAGPRNITGFAKPSPGGGPDEAGQTFFYNVVSNNPQLFAEAPAISPAGVLSFTPAADANGLATVSVSVTDSGGTANGGKDTSALQTFSITVNKVNDPPVLVVGGDQTAPEDSRVQVVPSFARALPGGGSDEVGQTFSYNVSTSNLELFSMAPAIDSFGRLTYQPKPDAVGTAIVEVVAVDDGGTADGGNPFSDPRSFAIRITGVNDAPLLTLAGNRVANEDSGAQLVAGFATASPGGGADEEGQTFAYDVRTDKPTLFAEAPAISPTGTLSFTPARDAIGVATVEVTVTDSGGTANGGLNTSLTRSFTISLSSVNDRPVVTLLGDRTDLEDGGSRLVSRFATASPGGGPDEAQQKVTFSVVENDNPGLFAVEPTIDDFGNLTYTLKPDAVGSAQLMVVGTDNGGTANGGNPVSEPVPFTITVSPVNDRPSLSLKGAQIVNEDAGPRTVLDFATPNPGGGADEGTQSFTYAVTTTNPGLFAAGPTISAAGDLLFTPQRDTVGSADVTVIAIDSGGTANGGQNTSLPKTFSIVVNPVNDAPVFTLLGDQTVLEDAPAQIVRSFAVGNPGGGPDEATQHFTYTVTHDNALLFKSAPQISEAGTLLYQVNPDIVGTATVTVVATDDGGTANGGAAVSTAQTFRITVNPVNDAPSFVVQGDRVVLEDAPPQTVPGFATANAGGGPDETGQGFSYTTQTDRPDLFVEAPVIDPDGMLRYTPRPDAFGLATVSVRVTDDGGTADGGKDTSGLQTFSILVDPINDAPLNQAPSLGIATEDQQFSFAAQSGGRISVSDSDAQMLEVSLSVGAGTLTVTTSEGFELSSRELALSAPPEALNQLLAGLRYTPSPDFFGTDRLAIVARDHGESGAGGPLQDVDTVTLSVQPVNDAPFVSVPGTQLATGDSLAFSIANSNRITIDDSDAGTTDLAATLSVTSGTLSVELEGLRFSGGRLSFAADLAALNDALDGLVYVPDPGTTEDRLEILVNDQGNTGRGGALEHSAGVDILVDGGLGLVGVLDGSAGDLPT
jgi:hypothetical protein